MHMASEHEVEKEVLLLPFFGQGHLFPFIELTKHLSSFLNFTTTLLIPSSLASSIPSSLHHRLIRVVETSSTASAHDPPHGPGPWGRQNEELMLGIETFLKGRSARPICVVIDVMMSWAKDLFIKFNIPTVALFTSGACSAAMEYGSWKAHVSDLKPGEARIIVGLPEEMAVTYDDIRRHVHNHPHHHHGSHGSRPMYRPTRPHGSMQHRGPPEPGQPPRWLDEVEGTIGIMIITSHELEGPFLDYVTGQIGKPVWGVGPLLPEEYWRSTSDLVHDHDVRAKKESSCSEEEVTKWLDSKPGGSVIYISFGSEVRPTLDEYAELVGALEETTRPFVWVIQPGAVRPGPPPHARGENSSTAKEEYYPDGLQSKVGERGLIIRGWAPQLLILSHPSTGAFMTHCGWNSTMEAIGRGIPLLAWPIRGDQHYNAKLIVNYLRVGHMVKNTEVVKKDDITRAIEKLLTDYSLKQRANEIQAKLAGGYRQSLISTFDKFKSFIVAI